ncbi:MAG: glucose/galactose MFS transporter [Sphingobacteriales bacterium]|nr:MAG: glucose/galactose MFS transporter [Sphingobacteriales bacterium]
MHQDTKKSYATSLILIGCLFFIFGFITWLNGTLIPFLKTACQLNIRQVSLVTFAFFISYFVMAIPSSAILRKTGFKNGMSLGLIIMACGCVMFIPAALQRSYPLFLTGLFVQGLGLSILQTASNPYVTIIGPIDSAAKRISMMGICNKAAGFLSPIVIGSILLSNLDTLDKSIKSTTDLAAKEAMLTELSGRIINPYIVLTIVLLLVAVMIRFSSLPNIRDEENDADKAIGVSDQRPLSSYTYLFLGAFAIFTYVGVEVLAGDYIINYGTYLHVPIEYAKYLTSLTLAFMVAGYFAGVFLTPRILSQEALLRIMIIISLVLIMGVLFTTGKTSILMLALLGFTHATMWPAIWPMSIKGLGRHTKTGSALLIMGISGGAIVPYIYGNLGVLYHGNLQLAFWIMIPCYLYMLMFATVGHRLGYKEPVKDSMA